MKNCFVTYKSLLYIKKLFISCILLIKTKTMKLQISHDFIDTQIINKLDEIGYNSFYTDMESGYHEFEVEFTLDGKYSFYTCFKIDNTRITKDTEYHGTNLRTGIETEFSVITNNMPSLQELFETWMDGYHKYLNNT